MLLNLRISHAIAASALIPAVLVMGNGPATAVDLTEEETVNRILIQEDSAPPWFPSPTRITRKVVGLTPRVNVCMRGEEEVAIDGVATTGTTWFDFAPPNTAYMNMGETVYLFDTDAAAEAAWERVVKAATGRCAGKDEIDLPESEDQPAIDVSSTQSVARGERQYGTRSVEITARSSWVPRGSTEVYRTGSGFDVWRLAGRSIVRIASTKVVPGSKASALSAQERATVRALSMVGAERAMQVTDPSNS